MVIDIIRVQGGENLTEVLNTPATDQEVSLRARKSSDWTELFVFDAWELAMLFKRQYDVVFEVTSLLPKSLRF